MVRKISWRLYIVSFVLSLIIFFSGIYVGILVDNKAVEDLRTETSLLSKQLSSLQLLFYVDNSTDFCIVYDEELRALDERIELMGYKLTYLEEEKNVVDVDLKKQYFLLEAQSYLLAERLINSCNKNYVLLINFYSNKDCEKCKQFGAEILKAREATNVPVKLYSFDGTLNSSVVEVFKNRYNISSYPTLVLNGKAYKGFKTSSEIKQLIENVSNS